MFYHFFKKSLFLISIAFYLFTESNLALAQVQNPINFNQDWLFTESDSKDYSLTTYQAKNWQKIVLPHDWSIEHDFSRNLEGCTAFMPGGIGWYSKTFPNKLKENQKCYILFDGVYNNAEYWCNGIRIGNHPYGYAPIYYDLTDILKPYDENNRISVRVDRSRYADSRWYTGSGIYRNVQLYILDKLHIPIWGITITSPEVSKDKAKVNIQIKVKNEYNKQQEATMVTDVFDPEEVKITSITTAISLKENDTANYTQNLVISEPSLWGIDSPRLYSAKTRIILSNNVLEERITRFGIRSIRFDIDKGFYLNEKNMKIKGVCLHHDAGLVGAAVPKDVWKRRLLLLKEGGCNAIRCAHNPASDEFLDLCDELGFLVQNEFYDEWDLPKDKRFNMQDKEVDYITRGNSEHFQLWAEKDLKNVIRSSRNHPCIFQWSIGNEIEWTYPGNRGATGIFDENDKDDKMDWTLWRTETPPHTPEQVCEYWKNFPKQNFSIGATAAKLAKWTREMDTTRPITANCILPTSSFETGYTDVLDVVGFSYKPDKYDYFKATYPNKVMMGTENVVRWYEWKAAKERDFISGIFLWTGVDYMGECRESDWPLKALPMAPIDLAGFPRASYYLYKALWREDIPVIKMYTQNEKKSIYKQAPDGKIIEKKKDYWKLAPRVWQDVNPHWNYTTNEKVIVEVYSNCEQVELFQNGKSLGTKYLKDQEDYAFKWAVIFKEGKLIAKGKKSNGTTNTAKLETTGKAIEIQLVPDREKIKANGIDVVHLTAQLTDKKGRAVTNTESQITFEIEGAHKFLGTDCGNTNKISGFKNKTVPTQFGRCLLVLQATNQTDTIKIKASSINGDVSSNLINIPVD
ncbi:threonine synthase [Labilibaculum filiforme]|uniref:Threonine synthase n=1 Tax=Labilibaculum filiforme TaxID=1940526 RepID=A0A2N3I0K2_9BACT|nr:glycoside hydrolase family 2 TIM barrel-domain containing protein [Labilibaculum filiforme]PKQ63824.1 threonine synthase [Labilibaculum filiforme]